MTPVAYAHDADVLSEGALVVRRFQRTRHPLAHRDGIALFDQMLAGGRAWNSMTDAQRRLIGYLCNPLLAAARIEGDQIEPPLLPERTRPSTVSSLRRKHLIVDDGLRLTALAVLAAQHGPGLSARRRGIQPVETIRPAGGHL